jgi:ATP-binding cassette, subfamily B, bacterial
LPLFILSVAIGLTSFLLSKGYFSKASKISERKISATTNLIEYLNDLTMGYKSIKINGLEDKFYSYIDSDISKAQLWRRDRVLNDEALIIVNNSLVFVSLILIMVIGIFYLSLDIEILMIFSIIMTRLKGTISTGMNGVLKIKKLLPSVNHVSDILKKLNNDRQVFTTKKVVSKNTPILIEFKGVSYAYDNLESILKDVNFIINPGDRVLISGDSGSGKSTLLMLLIGLIQPTKGEIKYNKNVMSNKMFYKFRQHISYASPDSYLLRGSINDNLFDSSENDGNVSRSIKLSLLQEKIENSLSGIDADIGINGNRLSVGERQRVIIARAISKNTQIVIFDEATSNLNIGFEDQIMKNIERESKPDSIFIVIAHKKPKKYKPNRIFSINNGLLTEKKY